VPLQPENKARLQIALLIVLATLMLAIPLLGARLAALAADFAAPGIGTDIANSDFVNYWMGAVLALQGNTALLFDPDAYYSHLAGLFGPDYPVHAWSYPPHALFVFWPLALLPYKSALAMFLGITLALFLLAANAFRKRAMPQAPAMLALAALLPFVLVNLASTQNGFLTGALLLGFLAWRSEKPASAGLCLALLTIKPQLGVLIPFMLAFDRQWRTIGWAACFTALLLTISVAVFGLEDWLAYVNVVMPFQHDIMLEWRGVMLLMMPTVLSALRLLGMEAELARAWQMAFSLACLPVVLYGLWRLRGASHQIPAALLLTGGTFLVTPYSFNYDMGALAAVAAIAFAGSAAGRAKTGAAASLAGELGCLALCLLPLGVMAMGLARVPVAAPLIALCLLLYGRPAMDAQSFPYSRAR
jgi:arabinofuranan 3-O-arabinosyltransferase